GLNVQLSVDGGDNTDDYIGGFLQNFSPDSIQEFAVQTAQEYADTARTVGGSVVIGTKHGTDQWHGDAAFYERTAGLNARFPFDDYLGTVRFDWSQSSRSQWFLRGGVDSYLTNNNLVQQATLPSTGVTTHANYFNVVVNNTFAFTPTWLGSFTFTTSTLNNR